MLNVDSHTKIYTSDSVSQPQMYLTSYADVVLAHAIFPPVLCSIQNFMTTENWTTLLLHCMIIQTFSAIVLTLKSLNCNGYHVWVSFYILGIYNHVASLSEAVILKAKISTLFIVTYIVGLS